MIVLGAISGATSHWPPLSSHRVGSGLHFISGRFKVASGGLSVPILAILFNNAGEGGDNYNHSFHKAQRVDPQST